MSSAAEVEAPSGQLRRFVEVLYGGGGVGLRERERKSESKRKEEEEEKKRRQSDQC